MDRYDVIVQALDEGVDPARAARSIAVALGVATHEARGWLDALPAMVREDVDEREAEQLLHALREAGARVRLKKRSPSRSAMARASSSVAPPARVPSVAPQPIARASSSVPPRGRPAEIDLDQLPVPELPVPPAYAAPAYAPPAVAAATHASSVAGTVASPVSTTAEDDEIAPARFWTALPGALVYPLRGPGWKFLAIGAVLSPLLPLSLLLATFMRLWGGAVAIAVVSTWLGYLLAWFRACCFGAMTGGDEPEGIPDGSTWRERIQEGGFLAFVLFGLMLLGVMVGVSAERGTTGLLDAGAQGTALLVFYGLMFLYWPLGVGLLAARGSMLAFFDLAIAVRAFTQVPLQLLAVLAVSVVAQGLAALMLFSVGQAAMAMSTWGGVVVVALAALPMAYVHAVMGTAMGLLFRVRPHVFM